MQLVSFRLHDDNLYQALHICTGYENLLWRWQRNSNSKFHFSDLNVSLQRFRSLFCIQTFALIVESKTRGNKNIFLIFDLRKMWIYVMISVRPAGWLSSRKWQKLLHCDFLRPCKNNKCQTLHDGGTHSALPIHTICSDLDCILRSQVSNSFNWKFYIVSN